LVNNKNYIHLQFKLVYEFSIINSEGLMIHVRVANVSQSQPNDIDLLKQNYQIVK